MCAPSDRHFGMYLKKKNDTYYNDINNATFYTTKPTFQLACGEKIKATTAKVRAV
jgi:hypothetical protein